VYDLSLDIPLPTIFVTMQARNNSAITVGGACRLNPVKAVEKAMLEAAQSFPYIANLMKTIGVKWESDSKFDTVDSFQKHAIFYTKYPLLREKAGYIVDPNAPANLELRPPNSYQHVQGTTAEELKMVSELLYRHGHRILVVDVTTPDLKKAGVHVVRVTVPGFQHLMGFHRYRLLGTKRLDEVAAALGHRLEETNPYPHPFP
jgi:ribosomal protein S12 methylthiotransferase accessory factor